MTLNCYIFNENKKLMNLLHFCDCTSLNFQNLIKPNFENFDDENSFIQQSFKSLLPATAITLTLLRVEILV